MDDFFRYAREAPLAEFNCYMPDDNERFFRNKHMVSAYLLGCLIADKIFGIDTIKVKQPEMDADFNYIWN